MSFLAHRTSVDIKHEAVYEAVSQMGCTGPLITQVCVRCFSVQHVHTVSCAYKH